LVVAIAVTVFATNVVSVGAAGQRKPEFQEKFSFEEPEARDDFLSDVCGIEVSVSESGMGTFKEYAGGSFVVHFNTNARFHSDTTGETLLRRDAATLRGSGEEVFNPEDETLTTLSSGCPHNGASRAKVWCCATLDRCASRGPSCSILVVSGSPKS
jgi:hypothetical protein